MPVAKLIFEYRDIIPKRDVNVNINYEKSKRCYKITLKNYNL